MVYKRVSFKVFLLANVLSLALCQYKVSLAEGARFPFFCSPQQTVLTNSKGGQDKPGLSASLCLIYLNTDSLKCGDVLLLVVKYNLSNMLHDKVPCMIKNVQSTWHCLERQHQGVFLVLQLKFLVGVWIKYEKVWTSIKSMKYENYLESILLLYYKECTRYLTLVEVSEGETRGGRVIGSADKVSPRHSNTIVSMV